MLHPRALKIGGICSLLPLSMLGHPTLLPSAILSQRQSCGALFTCFCILPPPGARAPGKQRLQVSFPAIPDGTRPSATAICRYHSDLGLLAKKRTWEYKLLV